MLFIYIDFKDTAGADDESVARRVLQAEQIVTGDAVLHGSRSLRVVRPPAHRDHDVLRSQRALLAVLQARQDGVGIHKLTVPVHVLYTPVNRCEDVVDEIHQ